MRILLVEDDPSIRQILTDLLEMDKHTVLCAESGEAGIELIGRDGIDLLITDLGLPGMDGWDVVKYSKRASATMPVIIITSWQERRAKEKIKRLVNTCLIRKPFRIGQIRDAIGEFASVLGK